MSADSRYSSTSELTPIARPSYADTARRALVTTGVALSVVVGALALWKLKVLLALLFAAITIAAAMRPGVEGSRSAGSRGRWAWRSTTSAILGLLALFLSFVVPDMITQVQARWHRPDHKLDTGAASSTGCSTRLETRLQAPAERRQADPSRASPIGEKAIEVLVGIFFTSRPPPTGSSSATA